MKIIRRNTFETNSSSTHSISLFNNILDQTITEDYLGNTSGELHIKLGTYDWGWKTISSAYDKLQYLLTSLAQSLACNFWYSNEITDEALEESKDVIYDDSCFQHLEYAVHKNSRFTSIVIDDFQGYIDHESYSYVYDLIEEANCLYLEDFLFSSSVQVRQGNDNSQDPECEECWW